MASRNHKGGGKGSNQFASRGQSKQRSRGAGSSYQTGAALDAAAVVTATPPASGSARKLNAHQRRGQETLLSDGYSDDEVDDVLEAGFHSFEYQGFRNGTQFSDGLGFSPEEAMQIASAGIDSYDVKKAQALYEGSGMDASAARDDALNGENPVPTAAKAASWAKAGVDPSPTPHVGFSDEEFDHLQESMKKDVSYVKQVSDLEDGDVFEIPTMEDDVHRFGKFWTVAGEQRYAPAQLGADGQFVNLADKGLRGFDEIEDSGIRRVSVFKADDRPIPYDARAWDREEGPGAVNDDMRKAFIENPAMKDGTPAVFVRTKSHRAREKLNGTVSGMAEQVGPNRYKDSLWVVPRCFEDSVDTLKPKVNSLG